MNESLIYGKDKTTRIVSVEPEVESLRIFRRNESGDLEVTSIPNKYWILSNEQIKPSWIKLQGDLHYKYGKQYKSLPDMRQDKFFLKKEGYDIYSINDGKEASMINKGITYFKDMRPNELSILSFDIETTSLDPNIPEAKVLLISNTFRHKGNITKRLFCYDEYENEGKMINDWCSWVRTMDPDCLIAYNGFLFDLPYLYHRAKLFSENLYLSRDNSPIKFEKYESKKRKSQTEDLHYHKAKIYGREFIDVYFLALDYDIVAKKYENYKLKNIIKQEKLEKPNRTFYDGDLIRKNYKIPEEWEKIKAYCVDDSDDSVSLFDLMSPARFYWTQIVPKSFQEMVCSATGAQVNSIMVRSYLQNGHSIPKADQIQTEFSGAISYGEPGVFKNCIKWDVASLYPSIILQYEIYNKKKDPEGNFLKLVNTLTNERLKNKRLAKETGNKYYQDLEQSQKIGINSSYGFMGTSGLNFNYLEGASEITKYGREILKKSIKWATGKDFNG